MQKIVTSKSNTTGITLRVHEVRCFEKFIQKFRQATVAWCDGNVEWRTACRTRVDQIGLQSVCTQATKDVPATQPIMPGNQRQAADNESRLTR